MEVAAGAAGYHRIEAGLNEGHGRDSGLGEEDWGDSARSQQGAGACRVSWAVVAIGGLY